MRNFAAGLAGLIFGLGLTISQMVNPDKVLSFLDILGDWDPSLALVMGSALAITTLGYWWSTGRGVPVLGGRFHLPENRQIDTPLVTGALMFGAGWGLVGLCPGPAIAILSFGEAKAWVFFAAMLAGMLAASRLGTGKAATA